MENENFYCVDYDHRTLKPRVISARSLGTGMIAGLTHEILIVDHPHDLKFIGWPIGDPHHSWSRDKKRKINHEITVIEEKITRLQNVITQLRLLKKDNQAAVKMSE